MQKPGEIVGEVNANGEFNQSIIRYGKYMVEIQLWEDGRVDLTAQRGKKVVRTESFDVDKQALEVTG